LNETPKQIEENVTSRNCAAGEWKSVKEAGLPIGANEFLVSDGEGNCALAQYGEGTELHHGYPALVLCWHHKGPGGMKLDFPIKFWAVVNQPNAQ